MRVVLAGTGSAVGKTTISTGIMRALSKEMKVQPFKVGPDYIDPTYHYLATGVPSRNLDSFFMSDDQIREAFCRGLEISNAKAGIIEGVRGLYEGISPISDVGSTSSIALALNSPVVLIMNTRSLVKSAAAIILGFEKLDPRVKIEGVILNFIKNRRHYLKTKKAIESLTDVKVLGGIPRKKELTVKQRHLGLIPAVENKKIIEYIDRWAKVVEENIDIDMLKEIMKDAGKIPSSRESLWVKENKKRVKIGLAYDKAFTFYYQENIEALEDNNAKIIKFSPCEDEMIPDVDGIYIGGGYPEIFSKELERNISMRKSIKKFHMDGRPIYAECGGLMYLMKALDSAKMCGIYPHIAKMTKNVQGLSYVIAKVENNNIISSKGEIIKGHEFHYSKIKITGNPKFAFRIMRGRGIVNSKDGLISNNTLANYMHIHVASYPKFAANFTRAALECG